MDQYTDRFMLTQKLKASVKTSRALTAAAQGNMMSGKQESPIKLANVCSGEGGEVLRRVW